MGLVLLTGRTRAITAITKLRTGHFAQGTLPRLGSAKTKGNIVKVREFPTSVFRWCWWETSKPTSKASPKSPFLQLWSFTKYKWL